MVNIEIIGQIQAVLEDIRLDALVAEWTLAVERGEVTE